MFKLFKSLMPKFYLSLAEGDEAKTGDQDDFDKKADDVLDQIEEKKEPPPESSAGEESEKDKKGDEKKTDETSGTDQDKTEQVKKVESDSSLSVEQKIEKVKEILGDDEKAIDAYIKSKGYHKDPAWQKQRELIDRLKKEKEEGTISEEDKAKLAEMEKVTSSREYIESSMKAQGFTQEAINKALREKGFEVKDSNIKSDIDLVANTLGIDTSKMTTQQKNDVEDIAKIARIIAEDIVSKKIPEAIKPVNEFINNASSKESANKIVDRMEETVKSEGILDWAKDVEPEINSFMDKNPNASQQDIYNHFLRFTRSANIERLKISKGKNTREAQKKSLRQNTGADGDSRILPEKTGDFDKDADSVLDTLGVT